MAGMKVLVIDDTPANRIILSRMLSELGAVVTEVEDAYHGFIELERASDKSDPYQLVLVDGRMPGIDGFGFVEKVKKELGFAQSTVMMLTSDNRSGDVARCQDLGISSYLVKPVKRSDLLAAITGAMGRGETPRRGEFEEKEELPDDADTRPMKILLVEDNEDNRLLIRAFLKKTPHQMDVAEDGQVAVDKFKAVKYDLVFMDVQMPVMDGYTATGEIRGWEQQQGLTATPVIALTAHATREDEQKSLDAGCTGHLTKPIKKARLLEALEEYSSVEV